MPTYVLLSTLTSKGRQTMHGNPDRLEVVNKEVAGYGCRVLAQYAVLGQYDFVTIIQAPDNESVARLSVDLGSRGTVNIETLPAISTLVLKEEPRGASKARKRPAKRK
jgi:uncharacterized protein with GYD domain